MRLGFTPCDCAASQFVRARRSRWMRLLFESHVLYECPGCGRKFLASPAVQAQVGLRKLAEKTAPSLAAEPAKGADPPLLPEGKT